jgi:hypothetical protein
VEGTVLVGGQPVETDDGQFREVPLNELVQVDGGMAEILLTPGAVLRMDRDSAMRMLANRLSDTHVALLKGKALIEIDALLDDNSISVTANRSQVRLLQRGLYHFDADLGELRVYDGKAEITGDGQLVQAKKGRSVALGETLLAAAKFNTKPKDDLYRWSEYRSELMMVSNRTVANNLGRRARLPGNAWYWDPWYGMYTFMLARGTARSPFGWTWYSPGSIWVLYTPPAWSTGYAGNSGSNSSWGGISTTSSGAAASSVPASAGVAVRSEASSSAPAAAPSGGRSR